MRSSGRSSILKALARTLVVCLSFSVSPFLHAVGCATPSFNRLMTFIAGQNTLVAAVADVDRHGHLDLITGDAFTANVYVHLGNGDSGSFQPRAGFPTGGQNTQRPLAGDFNEDGWPDIAVQNSSYDHPFSTVSRRPCARPARTAR